MLKEGGQDPKSYYIWALSPWGRDKPLWMNQVLVFPSCSKWKVTIVGMMELSFVKDLRGQIVQLLLATGIPFKASLPNNCWAISWLSPVMRNSPSNKLYCWTTLYKKSFFMPSSNWLDFLPTDSSYILWCYRKEISSTTCPLLSMATLPWFEDSEHYCLGKGRNFPFSVHHMLAPLITSHHPITACGWTYPVSLAL